MKTLKEYTNEHMLSGTSGMQGIHCMVKEFRSEVNRGIQHMLSENMHVLSLGKSGPAFGIIGR